MAEIKVFYEPEMELMTIFWEKPRENQICTELDYGVILIKDSDSNESIGIELISYKPDDNRLEGVSLYFGKERVH